jgi:hypothetical protein
MKTPNAEKRNVVVVVRKSDQSVMVVGPFETLNKAVLWTNEYTTWKPEHWDYEQDICELVAPDKV